MPREIITSIEVRGILASEKLRVIDTKIERAHSEIVYEVLAGESSILKCDNCSMGAKFIQHTRDHKGQNFIVLTCKSHAPSGYEKLSQERSG